MMGGKDALLIKSGLLLIISLNSQPEILKFRYVTIVKMQNGSETFLFRLRLYAVT